MKEKKGAATNHDNCASVPFKEQPHRSVARAQDVEFPTNPLVRLALGLLTFSPLYIAAIF